MHLLFFEKYAKITGKQKQKMNLDFFPGGGNRRRASAAQIRRIKRGGKKANKIKKKRELLHEISEIPAAEKLLKNSKNIWESAKKEISPPKKSRQKRRESFFEKLKLFFEK